MQKKTIIIVLGKDVWLLPNITVSVRAQKLRED